MIKIIAGWEKEGRICYTEFGQYHRLDGPALETFKIKQWRQNGKLHRLDGPAIQNDGEFDIYYKHNMIHNSEGPAIIYRSIRKPRYFLKDIEYVKEDWELKRKLPPYLI